MSEQYPAPYDQQPTGAGPEAKTNTLAIVGFVASFLVNIVGIIVSAIALKQIKQSGEKGRGLAIAGLVIGSLSLLVGLIIGILMIVGIVNAAQNGTITSSTTSYSFSSGEDETASASESALALESESAAALEEELLATLDPTSAYCLALDEFLLASDTIQQDPTSVDGYLASLTSLRDSAPTEEMRTSLTTAIDAVNSADAAAFESSLNEVVFDLGLDAVKCGIE